MYRKYIKRLLDIVLALIALVMLSPVIVVVAVLVRIKLGSPVLFKQKRIGKKDEVIVLRKFRSMSDERDENGDLLPDEIRLTKFGKTLRSTSIDELPSLLFNIVFRADMSLVGPRPLLPEYLPLYNDEQKRRHEVRPGITGLAQVNGRNATTWNERFKFDVEYVDNISFWLDMKIICKTIGVVFKRSGVSAEGHATMESFAVEKAREVETEREYENV